MKKSLIVVSVVLLLVVGTVMAATAQGDGLAGLVQPLVVDVVQLVPAEVMVAVPIGDGEFVTVTTPITINVALRVSIDGPEVVTVEPLPAEEAQVTIVPAEETPADLLDTRGLSYEVEAAEGLNVLQVQSQEGTLGMQIVAVLENATKEPMEYAEIVVSLYDANGNLVDVINGYAALDTLKAGQTSPATAISLSEGGSDVVRYVVQTQY